MRGLLLQREVAELVDDEQLGLGVEGDLVGELSFLLCLGQRGEERGSGDEERRVAGLDGGASERDGQVRLADAGRTEEQDVLGGGDEAAGAQLADELLVDGRLELEVELLERLDGRKWAIWMPMATRFFCLASVSSARSWSRKSR